MNPPSFAAWLAMKGLEADGWNPANRNMPVPDPQDKYAGSSAWNAQGVPFQPGGVMYEDGSYVVRIDPGAASMLPGLFGHAPGAFVPYPEG